MDEFEKWWEENSKIPSMIYCTSEDKCRSAWQAATLAERARCAEVVKEVDNRDWFKNQSMMADAIYKAIEEG